MVQYKIFIKKADDNKHKLFVYVFDGNNKTTLKVGSAKYDDYTLSKNIKKKENYLKRHQVNEDWTINGITSKGFWARYLLWNEKTITESMKDIEKRFPQTQVSWI